MHCCRNTGQVPCTAGMPAAVFIRAGAGLQQYSKLKTVPCRSLNFAAARTPAIDFEGAAAIRRKGCRHRVRLAPAAAQADRHLAHLRQCAAVLTAAAWNHGLKCGGSNAPRRGKGVRHTYTPLRTSLLSLLARSASEAAANVRGGAANAKHSASSSDDLPQPLGPACRMGKGIRQSGTGAHAAGQRQTPALRGPAAATHLRWRSSQDRSGTPASRPPPT